MTTPCRECKDRTVGCHGKCEKYAAYKEHNEEIKKVSRSYSDIDGFLSQQSVRRHKNPIRGKRI